MRLHVVGLPHTVTTKEYSSCAYTQKVLNFCKMMKSIGYTVYHYGGEGSIAECDEHISIVSTQQREDRFGPRQINKFPSVQFDVSLPYRVSANNTAINEIEKRIEQKDVICLIGGICQKPIADAFPNHQTVEFGIGYSGTFAPYKVFESYAWMHNVYGEQGVTDGRYYDAVIPNYFDPDDFPYSDKKEDYFLYIGRLITRKGVHIAVEAARKAGVKLKIAGQGIEKIEGNKIFCKEMILEGDHIEYVGEVGVEERGKLMSKAQGVLVPTMYLEPFGGVAVEAMMCGTPVITSDWGAFSETVQHGRTGYRCRTLEQFVWAIGNAHIINANYCRQRAIQNYSIHKIKHMYREYFTQLSGLWGEGRAGSNADRTDLNRLTKDYDFTQH